MCIRDRVESGKRIKALRKEHGLTQEQLAEQLGVADVYKRQDKTAKIKKRGKMHELY